MSNFRNISSSRTLSVIKICLILISLSLLSCEKDDYCDCTAVYQSYTDPEYQIVIHPDCDHNAPDGYYFVECDVPDY